MLGDKYNKDKFSGAPTPIRALSKYDIHVDDPKTVRTIYCERCGKPIRIVPRKIVVLPLKKFEENFIYDRVEGRIIRIKHLDLEKFSLEEETGVAEGLL